jgi:hypothetical protein
LVAEGRASATGDEGVEVHHAGLAADWPAVKRS